MTSPQHGRNEALNTTSEGYYNQTEKSKEEDEIRRTEGLNPSDDEPPTVFEPVRPGDREELTRIASFLSSRRPSTLGRRDSAAITRMDTIDEMALEDPRIDPGNPKFDAYLWSRKRLRILQQEGMEFPRAGVTFKNLNVSGSGEALQLQETVGSYLTAPLRPGKFFSFAKKTEHKTILRNFDGVIKGGELLMVLGRPGSGCSTFLKTISGELHGLNLDKDSTIHYNGIGMKKMHSEYKGEVLYNQEVDKHFPHLTVGQTLEFAATARAPSKRVLGQTRADYVRDVTQVVMAVFGLSHTYNTIVGNDYVRGVSGGERKRVSIAEMALARAPIAAWDNSTRGLDAASALEFVKALRMASNLAGSCHSVAIYQASQAIYDVFDKVTVLYEGRQIYFGPCNRAEQYFSKMGWAKPSRQTTGDFLTSVTNPQERRARDGMEKQVPRTPDEFEAYWKKSPEYAAVLQEIKDHEAQFPVGHVAEKDLAEKKHGQQAKHVRPKSPYLMSIWMQIRLCTKRAYQRIWNDKATTLTTVLGRIFMALIVGSIFYGTPAATAGFQSKGAVLFFAVLLNALISITEINSLYDQRPIIEKQASYAFVHPFAEAMGDIMADLPIKFASAAAFNIVLYFLAGLRYEPSQFFIFFLFTFIATLAMSAIFRTLAAATKSLAQAMALAGVMVLAIVIYTGFVIPGPQMHPWFSWIRWINPVFYTFEALVANEFHGREFICSNFVPAYPNLAGDTFVCSATGSVTGRRTVSGDQYIQYQYNYSYSHEWRNFGILIAFWIFFMFTYLTCTELNSATSSTAEFLVFRRGRVPAYMTKSDNDVKNGTIEVPTGDSESAKEEVVNMLPEQRDIFTWRNVCYDIPVKGGQRRLLDNVSGWVKPGTLTALMGVSGAGKTTLLDVLAQRVSIGVVTGDMFVNGKPLDASFQRKTGYVQQQDLHLQTSTVREALRFSAALRQSKSTPLSEKYEYVEDVIKMLNMEDFAEAVVGTPGEGLNVEQRKLLTIGVELAAKPALLLFLDEPTSGLDSQSSWSICAFLRKLADHGQAVLSTIHQPSAILFQQFDRLLFLAKGGKTVYFGDIGKDSRTLLDYFEANGARKCDAAENPAEYMLEIIGAGASGKATQDWPTVWKESQEAKNIQTELDEIHAHHAATTPNGTETLTTKSDQSEFAMPFIDQVWHVVIRVFQQYWRDPQYIFAKLVLGLASSLFIGFSFFLPNNSIQGFQDVLFSTFMLTSIFSTLVQQIMPRFVNQRSLYEVRERPSKAYSWAAFLIANIVVEIPYQIMLGILVWACYYFPIFGANQSALQQGLMLLFVVQFFIFASTFADLVIAAMPNAQMAGTIATLAFSLTLTFNGIMQPPNALPGFWIFMYRVSPLTYLIAGMTGNGLDGRVVRCSDHELSVFNPPSGTTCGAYLQRYLELAPGKLYNPDAMSDCHYCSLQSANQVLASSNIYPGERWRNWGIGWAYIGFNIFGAVALYYAFRVKHYNPTSIVRGIHDAGRFVGRMFSRKSETPTGRKAQDGRVF
ncbi:ABC multidrug transporter, putative [Talaromyces stipitatus ATCC 10500]|uniref:ABC multidrug transporter, putative n=1 Tax=Talaromyces stipitatus (strain ATCC 10500 / CBS 375.48 / QM 6759 / NRRL 1006) TaxID=441959 RepID=B8M520_TALSN|nr:ABC multidrug transporter, putative [Talaromyces stipitatus ATCC 10500]EED19626.1 ABC multidrug transporter, putative [Talaromyces stipitatus ATCC 10500]